MKRDFPIEFNITVSKRCGEGQTVCYGCAFEGLGTGARAWDSSILNVDVNYNRLLLCSGCLSSYLYHIANKCVHDSVYVNSHFLPFGATHDDVNRFLSDVLGGAVNEK